MGLSFSSVKKAYKVFNQLNQEFGIPEIIPAWPSDMQRMSDSEKEDPELNTVLGFDKKSDDGWENIFFITKDPSPELKQRFEELAGTIPNSSMNKKYRWNESLWIIGWF